MVSTPAFISWIDYVQQKALMTTNSYEVTLPADNLKTYSPKTVWRAQAGTGVWVQADFISNVPIDCVAFVAPRDGLLPSQTDTITLKLDSVMEGAGALYSGNLVWADYGYWFLKLPSTINARTARLNFTTSLSYVQGGRFWAGPGKVLENNFGFDWGREWSDTSSVDRAKRSGVLFRNFGVKYRQVNIGFEAASSNDADTFDAIDYAVGTSGQMLVCTHPDTPARKVLLGVPTQSSSVTEKDLFMYAKTYNLQEDL